MAKKIFIFTVILFYCAFPILAKIYYNGSHPKQIALTFDDGPTPGVTDNILDILRNENIRATFFVIGRKVKDNPQLVSQTFADGHEIGNHTYSHAPLDWMNKEKTLAELKETSELIMEVTGENVFLFRPPHGRLPYAKRKLIEKTGYDIVLWSVNADDFYQPKKGMREPDSIAKRVISQVRGGDIIVMHDNSQQTVKALPKIIKTLKKKGYHFVTVPELQYKGKFSKR